jgi:hypothetical protein
LFEQKKFSDRAKAFIAEQNGLTSVFLGMVLTEQQELDLLANPDYGNNNYRKQLLARWSFSEIIKSIGNKLEGASTIPLIQLNYFYKMASHLSHGDQVAMNMIEERKLREQTNYLLSTANHIVKIGRTVNEIVADTICVTHFFFKDIIALENWEKSFKPPLISIQKAHIFLQKELAKMGEYHSLSDDIY